MRNERRALRWVSWLTLAFGVATIASGGRVLFDPTARAAAGQVVPFVLVFNFVAGFAYVAAALGLVLERRWAAWLSIAIAAATSLVAVGFFAHVLGGGAYEVRTVLAMSVRTVWWLSVALLACRALGCGTTATEQ